MATFASGCFWCTESDFDKLPGVISTTSGYTGGTVPNATYKEVSSGRTGHAEAVQVVYDPAIVSYDKLLDHYWHNVDPFVAHRQFCDVGSQYRPVIFFHTEEQRAAAESSKARIQKMFKQPIVVRDYGRPRRSTGPRSITRTTTRRTAPSTGSTGSAAGAMAGSKRSGRPRRTE